MGKFFTSLLLVCGISANAFSQSLTVIDLTRIYHMSPDELPAFMKGKGWEGITTTIDGDAFEFSLQYNNVEDIVVKQVANGSRTVDYRLHNQADIDAYRANNVNFERFEHMTSNKKNIELYRHKNILQKLSTNTTKGILTIRYEVHPEVKFWNELIDANAHEDAYAVGTYLADEGGVVIGLSPDSSEAYVVALEDMKHGQGCSWSAKKSLVPGCFVSTKWKDANFDYSGLKNSKAVYKYVVGNKEMQTRAVQFSCDYSGANHNDWYMPSIAQLKMIADNKTDIDASLRQNGGISIAKMWYWSSSQYNETMVWAINFNTLMVGQSAKDGHDRVRPVRSVRIK